jgi:HEAT repeat protein
MTSLGECIEKLGCFDETERTYAAEDLGYLNVPEAVPHLLERLKIEPSMAVRDAIFQALTRMDGEAAIEGSVQLLKSDDPQIRNQAVAVLRGKGPRSIPFLSAVMQDGNKDVRKLVLDALCGVQSDGAREIYTAALSDPDQNVVITAVENLGRIRAGEFRNRIEGLLQASSHPMLTAVCLEALAGIGEASSLDVIRRSFPDTGALPDFLLAAWLKAIGALGSAREFAEVAKLLLVRGHHLRPAILGALKAIYSRCPSADPDKELLSALRTVVENGDPPLCRYQAVQALSLWAGHEDTAAFLVSCLSSSERLIRLAAAESLCRTEQPALKSVLAARALNESDEEVLQALDC